jgi:hypothetical protein
MTLHVCAFIPRVQSTDGKMNIQGARGHLAPKDFYIFHKWNYDFPKLKYKKPVLSCLA